MKRKTLTIVIAALLATMAPQQKSVAEPAAPIHNATQSGTITVHVENLKKASGILAVALFSSKKGFPETPSQAFRTKKQKITELSHVVVFENVPYGNYALSLLHDENHNGKMDKTILGIPKEGFGISNNPKIKLGGPNFDEARFSLNQKQTELTVAMKYF